jgi:hypothetical protein
MAMTTTDLTEALTSFDGRLISAGYTATGYEIIVKIGRLELTGSGSTFAEAIECALWWIYRSGSMWARRCAA